ncbi:MAG: Holliday junction resolvase RuvX [Zetaproteobacteria bacterium]|nr:MAG: Holliday junction resolvase RuvX [Zetaproteobacteria bacterium]
MAGCAVQLPLLALDVGMRRIGVAVCDALGIGCRGIACLDRGAPDWPEQVCRRATEYRCRGIVIGLPRNMDGSSGAQAEDCRRAAGELAAVCPLPIHFQDERLSSWEAKARLFAQGYSEKRVRKLLDQTAAAVILESFLARNVAPDHG